MIEITAVLNDYLTTGTGKVPGTNGTASLKAIREDIPAKLRMFVGAALKNIGDYKIVGSVGEINFTYAQIPWVGVFRRSATTSARRGVYIVLLFSKDMQSVWLSLNQGYTDFSMRYKPSKAATDAVKRCASAALNYITVPAGFVSGPIGLQAVTQLGQGYEQGAILSKQYLISQVPSDAQLESDLVVLLAEYDKIVALNLRSLVELDVLDENGFQACVDSLADESDVGEPSEGPQPPPPLKLPGAGAGGFRRDAKVAARAIKSAKHMCSFDSAANAHSYFQSNRTKKNYVEAHHLIPFSQQAGFPHSLDVEENVVALCPSCHKLLHHGVAAAKRHLLEGLLKSREAGLQSRGIVVNAGALVAMYGDLQNDD